MATKWLPSPLTDAFFSNFNREYIHKSLMDAIKKETGYAIDRQNDGDLQALMRSVYINMGRDPTTNVKAQLDALNAAVIFQAKQTVMTGVLQQVVYLRDISANPVPLPIPSNTSTYGNKLPQNFKFGF
jgi:hypothetical protein